MRLHWLFITLLWFSIFIPEWTGAQIIVPSDRLVDPAQAKADPGPPRFSLSATGGWTPLEILFGGMSGSPGLNFAPDGTAHFIGNWKTEVVYKFRTDGSWSAGKVLVTVPSFVLRLVSTVGPDGTPWFAYHTFAGDGRDIYVGRVAEGVGFEKVSPANGLKNFAPQLAVGPGTAWLTWYAPPDSGSASNIHVRRWADGSWQEPVMVTEGMAGYHWFSDIAVDSSGHAHLVWGDSRTGVYYYTSSVDGITWDDPFVINPAVLGVYAGGWPACSIDCDSDGYPHIAWVGQDILPGGTLADWDIYYSKFDGSHWTFPRKINVDNATVDAYPKLRIGNNDTRWIAWMDGNPASLDEYRVRAARSMDGHSWTEWRLDDNVYYYDGTPSMALDTGGVPWVVWSAAYEDFRNTDSDVVVTHYDATVPVRSGSVTGTGYVESAEVRWVVVEDAYAEFEIKRNAELAVSPVARKVATGFAEREPGVSPEREPPDFAR